MHWMYQNNGWSSVELLGMDSLPFLGILPLLLWLLAWKGWSLWLAAKRGERVWFIVLLMVNTFGLLEIFYIFVIAKQKETKDEESVSVPKKKCQRRDINPIKTKYVL